MVRKIRFWCMVVCTLFCTCMGGFTVQAGTIYTSPYVSFSPDGQAWTTNAGDRNVEWYEEDGSDDVKGDGKPTLRELQSGEHYYVVKRTGTIPIAKWYVRTSKVNCCHTGYPSDGEFHGVEFAMKTCFKAHFSAWRPICADCGRPVVEWNFYMSKAAARSLDYLEMGKDVFYYYLCPFNNNLEQGIQMAYHRCDAISSNRYRVVYEANTGGEIYSGYMSPSFHMYNNATLYEGQTVTPQTNLNINTYGRIGWEFVGWNTESDGTGTYYGDGAEILNLCEADYEQDKEQGTVYLYAMWRRSRSTLEIDPCGGMYRLNNGITEIEGDYGSYITIKAEDIDAPEGPEIVFDTCGGETLDTVRLPVEFAEWKQSVPFGGRFQGVQYYFMGADGSRDRITAIYEVLPYDLPEPYKENYSFAGWYYDSGYTRKAGDAWDEFVTTEDVTLYAQWVELVLYSEENFLANRQAGAVDLSWSQEDGRAKSYKIYQCAAGQDWQQIYTAEDVAETMEFRRKFSYCGRVENVEVPYTGFYRIEAAGAQGGNYGEYSGGLGGMVQGIFWLEKGQKISVRVGDQDGCYGGGYNYMYGAGGGYTSISTEDVLLLIAGGGGGATDCGNGGAGGLSTSLVEEGHDGESGEAGGGGGYLGGHAGETEIHYHEEGVCNHVHEGDPSVSGGCYTEPIKCGEKLTHIHTGTENWYWGGSDESYCPNCGADASKGESCTGHTTKYYRHECPVHGKRASNTSSSTPSKCTAIAEYGVTCGRTEDYFCGYPYDGYVISSQPAYGGSSYVNEELATSYTRTAGVHKGDGYVLIEAENVGFQTDDHLWGVAAADRAAPDAVAPESVTFRPVDEGIISVEWDRPRDLGTVYYHKAESYPAGHSEVLSVSNITADTLVSGIYGYLYLVDKYPDTEVTGRNGVLVENTKASAELKVSLTYENQYLHIAVVDNARNYSEITHIPLGSLVQGNASIKWPVLTEELTIDDTDFVHPADESKVYYVKCDGITPFTMHYGAYMKGIPAMNYQLNYAIIESTGVQGTFVRNSVYVPSCDVKAEIKEYPAGDLRFKIEGEGYLQNGNYTLATRNNNCKNLEVCRELILLEDAHGQRIQVIPVAGVDDAGTIIYSDYEKDKDNGLWLIGDGQAPVINGMEILEELPILDRRTQTILLQATAADELSGVNDFYIEIENQDNGSKTTYLPGEDGTIVVDICADEAIFSGDFTVTAYAVDHVGNERTMRYGTTEFDLQVSIERILSPYEPVFKRGESGCLKIMSWGYAERIEVEFPEGLAACNPDLNHVYEYELKGAYMQEENLFFMIPLDVPEGTDYTVTVRAYKGDAMLERYPALAVIGVRGSILDELRTRLR